jgi:transposase
MTGPPRTAQFGRKDAGIELWPQVVVEVAGPALERWTRRPARCGLAHQQIILSFLLRHGLISRYGHWTKMHRRWLRELVFAHPAHEEMLQRIERAEALCDRLKAAILELVPQWSLPPVVEASQALRRVSLIVASVIVAGVGNVGRFDSPPQLMAYLGLNPSEHSSGATIRRGAITKAGNTLARVCLVEAAWTCQFLARVTQIIRNRPQGLPEPIRKVAWKAQVRLSARYRNVLRRGGVETWGSCPHQIYLKC